MSTVNHPSTQAPGNRLLHWLRLGANHVQVVMMVAMFVAFILQIFFRYVMNKPLAWTEEVCVITWIWGILWGASFVMSNREDIRFDVLTTMLPRNTKRWFTIGASLSVVVILLVSLPSAWNYVRFMKVESTASLGIRMDHLFSVYIAFVLATIVRHTHIGIEAVRGKLFDDAPSDSELARDAA